MNEFFLHTKRPVYGFFRRLTADPSHAEELTQEPFSFSSAPPKCV
jgi:DNA-directed RNA polymerase specialized sigma24 family protein